MFILEKPYVSDYLKNTASEAQIPVLKNEHSQEINLPENTLLYSDDQAVNNYKNTPNARLYTNSENAIQWISKRLSDTSLPNTIQVFKDKAAFRRLTANLFPEVFFKTLKPAEIDELQVEELPKPFVIKPAVGFLSLAVYPVHSNQEWAMVKNKLKKDLNEAKNLFPTEVLDSTELLIEGYIPGTEFAFDAYYDENGKATILNILKHDFASAQDVSDRVYITSKNIMETYLPAFTQFLIDLGTLITLKNFPLHVEVRVDEDGKLLPIEVNPLRFGGFCTTADLTPYAWGFNPYLAFFNNEKPDWTKLLKDKEGKIFGLIVLDNSTGFKASEIKHFDYDKVFKQFEKPLEIRKLDYHKYPVFGFIFTETREENKEELTAILQSDLREFVTSN